MTVRLSATAVTVRVQGPGQCGYNTNKALYYIMMMHWQGPAPGGPGDSEGPGHGIMIVVGPGLDSDSTCGQARGWPLA